MPTDDQSAQRNRTILFGQTSLATMGWTLASPSVVLVYLAIAHDVPVFLAGLLVTVRRAANLTATTLGSEFAATRLHRKHSLAATDFVLATCYLLALSAVAFGTPLVITVAFILVVAMIGCTEEYQSLLNYDFMADLLESEDRKRLIYSAMIAGGLGSIALTWPVHQWLLHDDPFARHSAIVMIAIGCFCFSAGAMMLIRELVISPSVGQEAGRKKRVSRAAALGSYWNGLKDLWVMPWFRRFLAVRLSLQTIEMSIPFFAILAALNHGSSPKGLTALIISSALAMTVAAPLWRTVTEISNRLVMLLGAFLAGSSGLLLILNHFFHFADSIFLHAVALFCVTVAVQGVQSARYLFFMDTAPKAYRVRGLAASKSVARLSGITLATAMAALAHTQHVIWAIAVLACFNIIAACFAFFFARPAAAVPAKS